MYSFVNQHSCKCSKIKQILKALKQKVKEKFKKRQIFINELAVYEMALSDVESELGR